MRLTRDNIEVDLPTGWDGSIFVAATPEAPSQQGAYARSAPPGHPIVHAANFALPAARGDFGSGAVERMVPDDVFLALLEFHPDAARTALFKDRRQPGRIAPDEYRPDQLQRTIAGQAGVQRFFTVAGRAFCLYVVLGAYSRRAGLAPSVDSLLAATTIGNRP